MNFKEDFEKVLKDYLKIDREMRVGTDLLVNIMKIIELRKIAEHLSVLTNPIKDEWGICSNG